MKEIRDPAVILGLLEHGKLKEDFQNELETVLKELRRQSGDRNKVSGSLTLKLRMVVDSGVHVTFDSTIETSVPKEKRPSTMLFVTPDGTLSQEHPKQLRMDLREIGGDRDMEIAG